jgi:hypothetical protein
METPAAAAETTAEAAPTPETAVPTPEVTIPGPDAILEAIKAKIKSGAAEAAKPAEKPAEGEAKTDAPTLKTDRKLLSQLGIVQGERSKLQAQVKELEPFKADGEAYREVQKLFTGTADDRIAALGKLAGKEGIDVLAELVQTFYEREQESGTDATKPAATPEVKALTGLIEDLRKEVAALKTGNEGDAKAKAEASAKAEQQAAIDFTSRFLTANAKKYEISARKENVAEASELLLAAASKIVERDKIDVRALDNAAAEKIHHEAAAEVEKEYEQLGKRFAKVEEKPQFFDPNRYARFRTAPTPTVRSEKLSSNVKEREEQIRRRLIEKAEAGGFSRS